MSTYCVQFGGQGAPWFKELATYLEDANMKHFYSVVIDAIEEECSRTNISHILSQKFPLAKWMQEPDSLPDNIYLSKAAISLPMIQATQLAHIEYLHVNKLIERQELYKRVNCSIGHSQGLLAATLFAMYLEGDEYYKAIASYIKYLFYVGVKAQEVSTSTYPTEQERQDSAELGAPEPAPMAAILNQDSNQVQTLLNKINKDLPEKEQIYISLINSPTNCIISSSRASLIKFHKMVMPQLKNKELKYIYLHTSCPFHSEMLEEVKQPFEEAIEHIDFHYTGSMLKVPVYSFFDGRNMQEDKDLRFILYKELLIRRLNWANSLKPVIKLGTTTFLDFGPGKTSQRLTMDTCKNLQVVPEIFALALPAERSRYLEI